MDWVGRGGDGDGDGKGEMWLRCLDRGLEEGGDLDG